MNITSDIILKGKIWGFLFSKLKDTGLFDSYWSIFALCAALGIQHDKTLKFDTNSEDEVFTIPRAVLINYERRDLLELLFQTAVITSKNVDLSEDERLELAFDNDKEDVKADYHILIEFANYGANMLYERIKDSESDIARISDIIDLLDDAYNSTYIDDFEDIDIELD